jgi:hypothetical protein
MEATAYRVIRKLRDGSDGILGSAVLKSDGWRFIPRIQRKASRKGWPTPKACIPRGLAYDELRAICAKAEAK